MESREGKWKSDLSSINVSVAIVNIFFSFDENTGYLLPTPVPLAKPSRCAYMPHARKSKWQKRLSQWENRLLIQFSSESHSNPISTCLLILDFFFSLKTCSHPKDLVWTQPSSSEEWWPFSLQTHVIASMASHPTQVLPLLPCLKTVYKTRLKALSLL